MYFMDKVGLYVHQSSDNELAQIAPSKKMLFWKKGKYAYKHEFKDSNCCLLYSNLKTRYSIEHTKLHEVILGYACHKVLIYDDVNKENYLAWYTPQLQGGISPIGYLSVPGMVLKLETPRVSYLATEIIPQELNEKEFDIPKSKLKFSEKAFRSGIIP